MPRSQPHSLALFSLTPVSGNKRAEAVVAHPTNAHNISALSDGRLALDVGFHLRGKSSPTLATLGRGVDVDIFVEGSNISKLQCLFEIDLDTGVVMFHDRSNANRSQVFGKNAKPFEPERGTRKVLVQQGLNTVIGMGGEWCDLIQFDLEWHQNPLQTVETIKRYEAFSCDRIENPRLAITIDEAPTEGPSRRITRVHTPHARGLRPLKVRYVHTIGGLLGSGQFGKVYKVIDVDSGKFVAVKMIEQPTRKSEQEAWRISIYDALKREVEILSAIHHPHIVDYIGSQGWDEPQVEIFMGLKEGTLGSLIENGAHPVVVANSLFPHMLRALDFIASKGIIHRDVKPENILYVLGPNNKYHFQLGDFGLCNRAVDAKTCAGSNLYMAPEMFQAGDQTPKLDVWSLFVTILWTLDAEKFRQRSTQFKSLTEVRQAVLFAASHEASIRPIQEMAIIDPEKRASAAQILVKHFKGEGLSTPRKQVPPLESWHFPAIAITRARSPGRTQSTLTAPRT